jgi:vacuolar protein sorting-associated protein 45
MKVLLLDNVTTKFVSMVYSQTQILEQEVYLVEQLGKRHEPMHHMKAAVFIQPTEANISMLIQELKDPMFAEYHIFFSNIISLELLVKLGHGDEHELVKQVHEYFADFVAVNEDFFHLGTNSLTLSMAPTLTLESAHIFDRNVDGLLSVMLAMKRKPAQVRYQASSELARRIASEVVARMDRDDVFEFRTPGPLLLVVDRRDDPITPLLTQWTYQAMVHELLGLNYNRVVMKNVPGVKKDFEEVVLSCTQDSFFARHRYSNFGDLGSAVKELLDAYQKDMKSNEKISSIEDMQNFMQRYPALRSSSLNVNKHVTVMSELSRLTDTCQLFEVSQLEQEIACSNDHTLHKRELFAKLSNPSIKSLDKLRLSILFLLRYESYDEMREIKMKLNDCGLSQNDIRKIDSVIEYCGEARRAPGLFTAGQNDIVAQLGKAFGSIRGVENVYTQHQPLLSSTLDMFMKGKLKDSQFPLVSSHSSNKPSEVVIFIVGGATFEEATKIAEFNRANPSMRVILGGSCVHNSNSFLKEIAATFSNEKR